MRMAQGWDGRGLWPPPGRTSVAKEMLASRLTTPLVCRTSLLGFLVTEEQEKEQRKRRSKEINIITETGESGAVKRRDGAEKGLQMKRPKPGDPA